MYHRDQPTEIVLFIKYTSESSEVNTPELYSS